MIKIYVKFFWFRNLKVTILLHFWYRYRQHLAHLVRRNTAPSVQDDDGLQPEINLIEDR